MSDLLREINHFTEQVTHTSATLAQGKLARVIGLTLEAQGCSAPIGSRCWIEQHGKRYETEVVGFADDKLYLMSVDNIQGLAPGAKVNPTGKVAMAGVGDGLLGRIINGGGKPIDQGPPIKHACSYPLISKPINPLERGLIREPLDVGVKAINALFTVGRGQRMGLFAGSGVGKSVLLGMMTRFTNADVIVVGLIGERGREVKEFIEDSIGTEGLARSCVIAVPADQPPLMRLHGGLMATTVAEYFRDQGANVLLLMDSLTRFAQAQREIALAVGEPPATKGYPPSVFAKLPNLVERAGNVDGSGSITALYTVLVEGDDHQDPIADASRAILDGHLILSRELADAGHFPAIRIDGSISRVMDQVTTPEHVQLAQQFKKLQAKFLQNRDLINVGAYAPGSDPELDLAIKLQPQFNTFLQQGMNERSDFSMSMEQLMQACTLPAPPIEQEK